MSGKIKLDQGQCVISSLQGAKSLPGSLESQRGTVPLTTITIANALWTRVQYATLPLEDLTSEGAV